MANPDSILERWTGMIENNFKLTIQKAFDLPPDDRYVYRVENLSLTLSEVQEALESGNYRYCTPAKALTAFASNAKKGSARATVALYLQSRLVSPPPALKPAKLPKNVRFCNPYLDVWIWTCHETGFVGPFAGGSTGGGYAAPESARVSHPMLAVLYHHFGCVCPSVEALGIIVKAVSTNGGTTGGGGARGQQGEGKEGVVEIGSGNGYWAYLLRRMGVDVVAVDNMSALWRTMWIADTESADGVEYLRRRGGMKERVLLMVYMVTKGEFTKRVLKAYKGDTVVVAGTQNENRFTGFADMTVEEYFEREKKDFEMTVRIPLPSFAGKDEAMYVYQRKK